MMQRAQRRQAGRKREPLPDLDRQIIAQLQADGRRPFTQIAAELGMSEAAVRARANRLIADGVLEIVGVADPQALGYEVTALIAVTCDGSRVLEIADAVAAFPEAVRVVVTAGNHDLLVEVSCEDHEALLTFLSHRLGPIPGVRQVYSFVYLRVAKQTQRSATPERAPRRAGR